MDEIKVEIDEEILKAFDALPSAKGPAEIDWTPQKDALLLRYWPIKKHTEVARLLGVCSTTALKALKRYRELKEKGE